MDIQFIPCCHDSLHAAKKDCHSCLKYYDRNGSKYTLKEIRDVAVDYSSFKCIKWCHLRCNYPHISTFENTSQKCKNWLQQHGYIHDHSSQFETLKI